MRSEFIGWLLAAMIIGCRHQAEPSVIVGWGVCPDDGWAQCGYDQDGRELVRVRVMVEGDTGCGR